MDEQTRMWLASLGENDQAAATFAQMTGNFLACYRQSLSEGFEPAIAMILARQAFEVILRVSLESYTAAKATKKDKA